MSYLRLEDLIRCHRVSRQWQAVAIANPSLYKTLDLGTYFPASFKYDSGQSCVKMLRKYASNDVRFLILDLSIFVYACRKGDAETYIKLCQNLESLEIRGTSPERDVFPIAMFMSPHLRRLHAPGVRVTRDRLPGMFRRSRNLEYLCCGFDTYRHPDAIREEQGRKKQDIPQFPLVKDLDLRLFDFGDEWDLNDILLWFPEVRKFKVSSVNTENIRYRVDRLPIRLALPWETLESLHIANVPCRDILVYFPGSLRSLSLTGPFDYCHFITRLPMLQHLAIRSIDRIFLYKIITAVEESMENLLSFSYHQSDFTEGWEYFLKKGKNLASVSLSRVDYSICELLCRLEYLEEVEFGWCEEIHVKNLLQNCADATVECLKEIRLISPMKLNTQTLERSRELGVVIRVEYKPFEREV